MGRRSNYTDQYKSTGWCKALGRASTTLTPQQCAARQEMRAVRSEARAARIDAIAGQIAHRKLHRNLVRG
jgi:hypothetical protein